MKTRQKQKEIVALVQIAVIALAFFLLNGIIAMALYLVSEISISELLDYLLGLGTSESIAFFGYHFYKKAKEKFWLWIEDEEVYVVSERKIKELKKLLRRK